MLALVQDSATERMRSQAQGHRRRLNRSREDRYRRQLASLTGDERDAGELMIRAEERPARPNIVRGVAGTRRRLQRTKRRNVASALAAEMNTQALL